MGHSNIALVLLPGMDGTGELFAPLLAALGDREDVVVVTYPGDEPMTYARIETLVRSKLPTDRPFVMVAESFSGPVAVAIAAAPPENLCGLALCCTFARNPRPGLSWLRGLLPMLPWRAVPVRFAAAILFGRWATPANRMALRRALAQVSSAVMAARVSAVMAVDVTARLSAIRVPVLLLRAREDRVVPRRMIDEIHRRIPQARAEELPAPHLMLQVMPTEASEILQSFVGRCAEVAGNAGRATQ